MLVRLIQTAKGRKMDKSSLIKAEKNHVLIVIVCCVLINPGAKYVVLSASNRTCIKARLAVNGKPLSKAATPIHVLFEAPDQLIL